MAKMECYKQGSHSCTQKNTGREVNSLVFWHHYR